MPSGRRARRGRSAWQQKVSSASCCGSGARSAAAAPAGAGAPAGQPLPLPPGAQPLRFEPPALAGCCPADSEALAEEEAAAGVELCEPLESGWALWRDFFSVAPITTTAGAVTSTSLDFIAP